MNKVLSHVHQRPIPVCFQCSWPPIFLFLSILIPSPIFLSSPVSCPFSLHPCLPPPPFSHARSTVTHLLFLCVYLWNMSVLANMDLCMCSCPGCITVCNEQAGANHYANETISRTIPDLHWIRYKSTIFLHISLTLCLCLCVYPSMTTRAVTSATYQSTSPWCGMETLSLTTRLTFKVQHFLCCLTK